MPQEESNLFEFGDFSLDSVERALYRSGERIPITPKALETLLVLVRKAGHVVSKEKIMQEVWPDSFVEEGNLNVNIFALRKVLGDSSGGKSYIETVPRRGFLFAAPVQIALRQNGPLVVETRTRARIVTEEISEIPSPSEISERLGHSALPMGKVTRNSHWMWVIASVAAVVLLVAIWFYATAGNVPGINSIAVLPIVNAASDPNLEYLSEGMTEGLIGSLSELPGLKVVSRTSAYHYKGRESEASGVGRELQVRAVLVGRMFARKDGFSLQFELVDVKDGSRIWGGKFDRRLAGLPTLQDEVAYEISSKLRLNQGRGALATKPPRHGTEDPEAYQLYLKGRYYWNQLTGDGLKKSAAYFHQAIEKDPRYALAYDGLADYYAKLTYVENVAPGEVFPRAKEYALKALELDDNLAEAHNSLASIREDYDWDFAGAEQEYRRAITLNPNHSTGYEWYGHYLSRMGRHDEALARIRQGLSVDPLSPILNINFATFLYFARRYDEAVGQANKTLELEPQFAYAHFLLGLAYRQQGKFNECIAEFKKAGPAFDDDAYVLGYLGKIYAEGGNKQAALENLRKLRQLSSKGYTSPVAAAMIHFGLREFDRGFAEMEKAYQAHDPYLLYMKVDPAFDPVRSDPRFQALVARIGYPQ